MLQKIIEKALKEYETTKIIEGISQDELVGIALKYKRSELIKEGLMPQIERSAEQCFRDYLYQKDNELFLKYLSVKDGLVDETEKKEFWSANTEKLGDKQFKLDYINSRITPDFSHLKQAVIDIITKKYQERHNQLRKDAKNNKVNPGQFITNLEIIESEASEILYASILKNTLLQGMNRSKPATFLYYLCTRQTNNEGVPDITPNFESVTKINKDGESEKRSGQTYLKQLYKIIEFSSKLKGFNHKLIIADFDNYKYVGYSENVIKALIEKTEIYKADIQTKTSNLEILTQTEFFEPRMDKALFNDIFESVINNDGKYLPQEQIHKEMENYMITKQRSLKEWNVDKNLFYTASSIARNMAEGKALDCDTSTNYVLLVFNNRTTNGIRFNTLAENKIPFIALPKDKEVSQW